FLPRNGPQLPGIGAVTAKFTSAPRQAAPVPGPHGMGLWPLPGQYSARHGRARGLADPAFRPLSGGRGLGPSPGQSAARPRLPVSFCLGRTGLARPALRQALDD
nr:hypothetical protein [Tanacetum cinerariifolium]